MVAPALVLVTETAGSEKNVEYFRQLLTRMRQMRPQLNVQLAFADDPTQAIDDLRLREPSKSSEDDSDDEFPAQLAPAEIVLVPLEISSVQEPRPGAQSLATAIRAAYVDSKVHLARPIGPASELLGIVDLRLRAALSALRVTELDALVLLAPGGADTRGATLLSRRARQWAARHKLPVNLAIADSPSTSLSSAIANLHDQGRRRIAVGCLHLAADDEFQAQLEIAKACDALAVSAPLGVDDRILEIAMGRYAFAAMAMLDDAHPVPDSSDEDDAE